MLIVEYTPKLLKAPKLPFQRLLEVCRCQESQLQRLQETCWAFRNGFRALVTGLNLSHLNRETTIFTADPYCGNLNKIP